MTLGEATTTTPAHRSSGKGRHMGDSRQRCTCRDAVEAAAVDNFDALGGRLVVVQLDHLLDPDHFACSSQFASRVEGSIF